MADAQTAFEKRVSDADAVRTTAGDEAMAANELTPERRIDTHGAVVFLCRERAYKLKRAVKFPYMDFSTEGRRAAMCAAEIDVNRRSAPEIYLGVAPVLRRDGRLARFVR